MKKLEITREMKLKHLIYCIGKKENNTYFKSRPYGRLLTYQELNYPLRMKVGNKNIKINIEKKTRQLMTKYLLSNFKFIVIGNPKRLLKIEKDLYTLIQLEELKKKESITLKDVKEGINDFLYQIFRYETFSSANPLKDWGPYQLIEELKNSVCVYCNAQFTITVIRQENAGKRELKIRPSLDHFFPRSKHPLLGVSIYNLIPACDTCNSNLKGDKAILLDQNIHPYLDNLDELGYFEREFKVSLPNTFSDYSDFYSQVVGRSTNYKIKLKPYYKSVEKKIVGYEKLFEIEERYSHHKKIINDLVKKNLIYTALYLNELRDSYDFLFDKTYSLKEITIDDDINNNILSKIVKDITNRELHLFK